MTELKLFRAGAEQVLVPGPSGGRAAPRVRPSLEAAARFVKSRKDATRAPQLRDETLLDTKLGRSGCKSPNTDVCQD